MSRAEKARANRKPVNMGKHMNFVWECPCGKRCRGNGGWGNHKRVCVIYMANPLAAKRVPSIVKF